MQEISLQRPIPKLSLDVGPGGAPKSPASQQNVARKANQGQVPQGLRAEVEGWFGTGNQQAEPRQQTEGTANVPAPLMSYIDDEIARMNKHLDRFRPYGKVDVEAVLRLERYQGIKSQLSQPTPQYDDLVAQLQTEYQQAEQEFTTAKNQIVPFSQDPGQEAMWGDGYFLELQQDIVHEKGILQKAAAALDADDKAYIARKIDQYKDKQSAVSARGQTLTKMETAHTRMNTIQALRPYLPTPSTPAAAK